jgi:hypothetical protein
VDQHQLTQLRTALSIARQRQWTTLLVWAPMHIGLIGLCLALEVSLAFLGPVAAPPSPRMQSVLDIVIQAGSISMVAALGMTFVGGLCMLILNRRAARLVRDMHDWQSWSLHATRPMYFGNWRIKPTSDGVLIEYAFIPWPARWLVLKAMITLTVTFMVLAFAFRPHLSGFIVIAGFSCLGLLAFVMCARVTELRLQPSNPGGHVTRCHRILLWRSKPQSIPLQSIEPLVESVRYPGSQENHTYTRLVLSTGVCELIGFGVESMGTLEARLLAAAIRSAAPHSGG